MANTKIPWTEKTWNPVTGCNKVSQGCKNCYAETIAKRFWGERKFTDVQCHPERLDQPLHWKKPAKIFVNSMSDLFHDNVPLGFIEKVWDTMFDTPQHIYQILTKRPQRMLRFSLWMENEFRAIDYKNIWLGVSAENQQTADLRIPLLLETPAAVRFLSIEPMLELIDLELLGRNYDWVICGCESGQNARHFNLDWARNLRDQCKTIGVPFFMKQLQINGKLVKNIEDFPTDLQIREYPNNG